MVKKELITIPDVDRDRMAILHDEIMPRVREMSEIAARTLGLDIRTHKAIFEPHEQPATTDSPNSDEPKKWLVRLLINDSGKSTGCYLRGEGYVTLCGGKPEIVAADSRPD